MRKTILTGVVVAGLAGIGLTGCYNDNYEDLYTGSGGGGCDTANLTYSGAISTIFNQNCALSGCHATGSALGGHILDNYQGVKNTANSGRLIGAIKWQTGFSAMPKNQPQLASCDILKIETWVNKGMPQ